MLSCFLSILYSFDPACCMFRLYGVCINLLVIFCEFEASGELISCFLSIRIKSRLLGQVVLAAYCF